MDLDRPSRRGAGADQARARSQARIQSVERGGSGHDSERETASDGASAHYRVDLVDLAASLDRRVTVNRLEPVVGGSVQGLERLHLGGSRPEEHGALMGRSFRKEAFEVFPVSEHDRYAVDAPA